MIEKGIFIVGFRKSGTTSLFDMLSRHPSVGRPAFKEPQFFCLDEETVERHFDWYASAMVRDDKALLDASTLYVHDPRVRRTIARHVRQPRFVICLRTPVSRFISAYTHMCNRGRSERRPLDEVLAGHTSSAAGELLAQEERNLAQAKREGRVDPNYLGEDYHRRSFGAHFPTRLPDADVFYRYFKESLYSRVLDGWDGPEVRLVSFERLIRRPEAEMRALLEFLELPFPDDFDCDLPANRNIAVRESPRLIRIKDHLRRHGMTRLLPGRLAMGIKRFLGAPPSIGITESNKATLWRLLEEEFTYWRLNRPEVHESWTGTRKASRLP